jgi:hypothetical protein
VHPNRIWPCGISSTLERNKNGSMLNGKRARRASRGACQHEEEPPRGGSLIIDASIANLMRAVRTAFARANGVVARIAFGASFSGRYIAILATYTACVIPTRIADTAFLSMCLRQDHPNDSHLDSICLFHPRRPQHNGTLDCMLCFVRASG